MGSSQLPETSTEQNTSLAADSSNKLERLRRAQWLRAAILGANDGLLSTTSLMLGVGAAREDKRSMVLSGLAGALAGACSMAVGEFVSVATQRDIEKATAVASHGSKADEEDGAGMNRCLAASPSKTSYKRMICDGRLGEPIDKSPPNRVSPGRSPIMKVIKEDEANGRAPQENVGQDVLGSPLRAAVASSLSFLCGAFVPLASAIFVDENVARVVAIIVVTSIALALFGGIGAYLGGSAVRISAARVLFGGWVAMAITYGLLKPFDSDDNGSVDRD